MNWLNRIFHSEKKEEPKAQSPQPTVHSRSVRGFRALRICAVALVFVSGSLWLAWAVQTTATQSSWIGVANINSSTATFAGWTDYAAKDAGIAAGTDIQLQSTGYTVTDDGTILCTVNGTLTTCGTSGTATSGSGTFAAGTSTATNTAVSGTGSAASVKLLGTWVWVCGDPLTINHTTANGVAPENKTVTYGTVSTTLGGTGSKCWITQNLGAVTNAASATESTEPNAGWYWQFNRKAGWKYVASLYRFTTPTTWDSSNDNTYTGWDPGKDPCTIELGAGWRLPTSAEWTAVDSNGAWVDYTNTYASVLKLHAAGYLDTSNGALDTRGSSGHYWSSTQNSSTTGYKLGFNSSVSAMNNNDKAYGFSVRCLKD